MNVEEIINTRPDKQNIGSCAPWKLRHLANICQKLKPKLIIESGTWKGNSLWLFRKLNPDTTIHSYDINYSNLMFKDKSIHYHEHDINEHSYKYHAKINDLIFFDDHYSQVSRLMWAYYSGFKHIVFDDNVPKDKLHLFKNPPRSTLEEIKEEHFLPDFIEKYEILHYDGSQPGVVNNGQTFLTYVKIEE
jgi:hypothetical protein